MRKLRVFCTRKLGRFVGRCVGLLGVLFLIVNLISCQDDFLTRVRDKDCVKNRVKRAKIVRFTLC